MAKGARIADLQSRMAIHALPHRHLSPDPLDAGGVLLVAVAGGATRLLLVFHDRDMAEVYQIRLPCKRLPRFIRILEALEVGLLLGGAAVVADLAVADGGDPLISAILVIGVSGLAV